MVEVQHLNSYLNGKQLEIQAFVTETLTGKKLNGSSIATFYTNAIKMTYLDYSARDFKPGLIYSGTVRASCESVGIYYSLCVGL